MNKRKVLILLLAISTISCLSKNFNCFATEDKICSSYKLKQNTANEVLDKYMAKPLYEETKLFHDGLKKLCKVNLLNLGNYNEENIKTCKNFDLDLFSKIKLRIESMTDFQEYKDVKEFIFMCLVNNYLTKFLSNEKGNFYQLMIEVMNKGKVWIGMEKILNEFKDKKANDEINGETFHEFLSIKQALPNDRVKMNLNPVFREEIDNLKKFLLTKFKDAIDEELKIAFKTMLDKIVIFESIIDYCIYLANTFKQNMTSTDKELNNFLENRL